MLSRRDCSTGKVFCGCVGSEMRKEYAVVGDIVNLWYELDSSAVSTLCSEPTSDCSARLMKAAQEFGILCDCVTQELAADTVEFQELPSITVKGKSGPIRVFHPSRRARERTRVGVRRDADSILHIVKEVPLTHTDPTFLGGHVAVRSTKSLVGKRRKPCWPPRSAPSCSRPRTMAA